MSMQMPSMQARSAWLATAEPLGTLLVQLAYMLQHPDRVGAEA
jgi:hypothetical protein